MSYSSSRSSSPSTSLSTSHSSTKPMQIGFTPLGTDAVLDIFHTSSTQSSRYSTCAYPSWPCSASFEKKNDRRPSSYVSDEDLFGDDDEPYLSEPPQAPRSAEAWAAQPVARPLLPPVTDTRRRSSTSSTGSRKQRTNAKSSLSKK